MAANGYSTLVHGLTMDEIEALQREVEQAKKQAYCRYSIRITA